MLLNKLNQEVEQPIDPPEYAEWSQRDIDAGIAKLVEQIEDGADWDVNGWDEYGDDKLNLINKILSINFSKVAHSKTALSIACLISKALSSKSIVLEKCIAKIS